MKPLYNCIVFFFLFLCSCHFNQTETLEVVANLPKNLKECSGIETLEDSNTFWVINDSGNYNELYELSAKGDMLRSVTVTNTLNKDWEDLATNGSSELFIGDFGNNNNLRKDLAIYTINLNAIYNGEITASKIEFYFEDQEKFPPKKKDRNFDVEGFVYKDGYFYLFTKNRSSQFDGITKLYKVIANQGKQKAVLIDYFVTCQEQSNCVITGATLSKGKNKLVLLTHDKLFQFTNFIGDDFFNGDLETVHLKHQTQKEGICFKGNELFIVDETIKNQDGKLYKVLATK